MIGKKKRIGAAFLLALCLMLAGCGAGGSGQVQGSADQGGAGSAAEEAAEQTVFAMDTVMTMKVYGADGKEILSRAEDEIMRLDSLLSRGSESSEVYQLNSEGTAEVSDDTAELVRSAMSISESTEGAFDITVAPVMDLWGFYGQQFHVPSQEEIASTPSL